jgi:predicted flap endonuclease-1-like 5' DNA nuclease
MGIIKNYQSKGSCKVTFSHPVSAVAGAKSVHVLGDFNNWDINIAAKMKKGKDEFSTVIEINAGKTYEFRYLIDSTEWDNDFAADGYVPSPYAGINNSIVILDHVLKTAEPKPKSAKPAGTKSAKTVASAPKAVKVEEKKAAKPAPAKAKLETPTKPVADKKVKPAVNVAKDDLKKIEGIGPKIAEILSGKGIVTFSDLAKTKAENIKKILEVAGPKFNVHEPSTWPAQAALAAKGKWDELKKLQDELNAGKSKK